MYDFLKTKQQEVLINNGISYSNDFKYLIYHLKDFSYKIDIDRNTLNNKKRLNFKSNLEISLSFYDITVNFLINLKSF